MRELFGICLIGKRKKNVVGHRCFLHEPTKIFSLQNGKKIEGECDFLIEKNTPNYYYYHHYYYYFKTFAFQRWLFFLFLFSQLAFFSFSFFLVVGMTGFASFSSLFLFFFFIGLTRCDFIFQHDIYFLINLGDCFFFFFCLFVTFFCFNWA